MKRFMQRYLTSTTHSAANALCKPCVNPHQYVHRKVIVVSFVFVFVFLIISFSFQKSTKKKNKGDTVYLCVRVSVFVQGALYQHYKGNCYKVLHVGHHCETLDPYVVYEAQYTCKTFGNKAVWVRPQSSFLESVSRPNAHPSSPTIARFTFLSSSWYIIFLRLYILFFFLKRISLIFNH